MKKLSMAALIPAMVGASFFASGQDVDQLIKGSKNDVNMFADGYLSPFVRAFGAGLNQGWYNTAQNHKFPGFDLTISAAYIPIPSGEKKFYIDNNKTEQVDLDGVGPTGGGYVPTFFGSSDDTNQTLSISGVKASDVPAGAGIPMAVPLVNLGIGLPKGIDVKLRFVPSLNIEDVKLSMFGVGIMHDIKQYIPGLKKLPFDLAVFGGFTKFKTNLSIDVNTNQEVDFDVKSTTFQVLVSKKLAVLTVYGGVGYDMVNGGINVLGKYDSDGNSNTPPDLENPVDIDTKTKSARVTTGLRLKLGPITFHGDYTRSKFNIFTGGFGVSIR